MMTATAAETAGQPSQALGVAFALLSASGLGLAIAVSRFAYEGGTNGLTVASTRSVLVAIGLGAFCIISGRGLRLPLRAWLHALGLGILASMMFYGNIGAVEFIPVSLTALLFFTYPPMIALLTAVVVRERVPAMKFAAIAIAFFGLALMLGVSFDAVDLRGVALVMAAAVCCAWNAVWLVRKLKDADIMVVTFHMSAMAALILVVATILGSALQWPETNGGWAGLAGVVLLQGSALPLYFIAIPLIGALKSGMLSNIQPAVSIVAAFLFFAELLSPVQTLGGAMVLGGIFLMQGYDSHAARRAQVS